MAHSEIEQYLEDRVHDVSEKAVSHWLATQRLNSVVLCILAYCGDELSAPPKTASTLELVADRIRRKKADYQRRLRWSNHGVQEVNLMKLLVPISITPSDLDPAWVADMNTFGRSRGDLAHRSITAIRTLINPKDEYEMVQRLLKGLGDLDDRLNACL